MTVASPTMVAPHARLSSVPIKRWIVILSLVAFAALLLRNGYDMVRFAQIALTYPFDLDYGEGIVWQQAREIVAGRGYAPLGVFPAIVFHYPPVYHLTSMAVARLFGMDELFAGRAVSIASTIATMGLCAWLTAAMMPTDTRRDVRVVTASAAPMIFISFWPVMTWFPFMRVDMLAGALSMGGLAVAVLALKRPALIVPAAILFVLSIYTKQTSIAAPAAAFLMLLVLRPRIGFVLFGICLALGLAALAWLSVASDGGFLRHILGYNLNRYDGQNISVLGGILLDHSAFFAACLLGVAFVGRRLHEVARAAGGITAWRRRHGEDRRVAAELAILLFFCLKLAMVPMILKSGASYNYLIEWLSSVAIFAAIGITPAVAGAFDRKASIPALLAAATLLLPVQTLCRVDWGLTMNGARHSAEILSPLVARIRAADKPVISDFMVLVIRGGKPVVWEPAIVAELSHSGHYDERAFVRLVRQHRFAFFITKGERGMPVFDSRYDPIIADAIDAAYPHRVEIAGMTVHTP